MIISLRGPPEVKREHVEARLLSIAHKMPVLPDAMQVDEQLNQYSSILILDYCNLQSQGENHWVTYLLVSPTRSSIAGYALRSDVDGILRWHNGEESSEHPKPPAETELLRHESGCISFAKIWKHVAKFIS